MFFEVRKSVSKSGDLKTKIQNASEEKFRNFDIETQTIAYVVRVAPKHAVSLSPEWFATEIYSKIIAVLKDKRAIMSRELLALEVKDSGINADEVEVLEDTLDDVFNEDIDQYDEHTFRALLAQVIKMYDSRRIFITIANVVTHMDTFNLDEDRDKIQQAVQTTHMNDHKQGGFYVDDYEERKEVLKERSKKRYESDSDHTGVPTGIPQFDKVIGGVMRGEFVVLGGRTGIGKTAALIHHGITAWRAGFNTLIVSGEMGKHALQFRIDSNITAIPSTLFRLSELSDTHYSQWDNSIVDLRATNQDSFLYIRSFSRGFTVEDIEKEAYWLQDETGKSVDVICMDYMNIMRPKKTKGKQGRMQEWPSQADAVWDFKELCIDFDAAGFTANQIVDEAYNKRFLSPSDLKYSRAISEAAPIIIGLTQCEEDRLCNRMIYQPIKVREADPPKPIYLNPRMEIMRIHNQLSDTYDSLSEIKSNTVDMDAKKRKKNKRKMIQEL
jgi:replicative DNA helicase